MGWDVEKESFANAARGQSAQNSAGIQTLLDVRITLPQVTGLRAGAGGTSRRGLVYWMAC